MHMGMAHRHRHWGGEGLDGVKGRAGGSQWGENGHIYAILSIIMYYLKHIKNIYLKRFHSSTIAITIPCIWGELFLI